MPPSRRLILFVATAISLAFFAASAQAGSWLEGPIVGTSDYLHLDSVAVNSAGNSTFTWTQSAENSDVYVQTRTPNGGVHARRQLTNGVSPVLEATENGTVLAWFERNTPDPDLPGGKVQIQGLDASGSPTATTTIATIENHVNAQLSLTATPSGDIAVAWLETEQDSASTLHFRKVSAGGQLGPQIDLGPVQPPSSLVGDPSNGISLEMTPDGRAYLAWLAMVPIDQADPESGLEAQARVARFKPSGETDGSSLLAEANERPTHVEVEAGAGGAAVLWRLRNSGGGSSFSSLMASLLAPNGSIVGAAQHVSGGVLYTGPMTDFNIAPDGTKTIVYARSVTELDSTIYVRRLFEDGTLGPETRLSPELGVGQRAVSPMITPIQDDSLVVAWMVFSNSGGNPWPSNTLMSREIAADGSLHPKTNVVPGGEDAFWGNAMLAGNRQGDVTMAWSKFVPASDPPQPGVETKMMIYSASYDARPPQVVASIPTRLRRGENGKMSVDATASSGIDTIEWDFGDGSGAKGASVSHAYGRAGKYTVAVTVTDKGGTSKVVSQVIEVVEPGADRTKARLKLTKVVRKQRLVKINGTLNPQASGQVNITWKQKAGRKSLTFKRRARISKGRFKATIRLNRKLAASRAVGKLTVTYRGNKKTLPARVIRKVKAPKVR